VLKILIPYGTSEGQTAIIARCLADEIRSEGHEAVPVEITRAAPAPVPDGYNAIIVGASVHRGRHQAAVGEYVRRHRATLARAPSAFFSVSLAAAERTPEARKEAEGYAEEFFRQVEWRPSMVGLFAGALTYTSYNFLLRWIMKRIARSKGSKDLDTTRDYVYTDWEGVKRFARAFMERAAPKVHSVGLESGR
jgi:menaquinone-dependent protoporphyrinogen oxidase